MKSVKHYLLQIKLVLQFNGILYIHVANS